MGFGNAGRWLALGSILLAGQRAGNAQEPPPCRSYLVPCNIGDHYSGTFHRVSTVESSNGKTTEDVTVRVLHGKARCEGSIVSTDPSALVGPIRGDGLFIVEWGVGVENDAALPWYRIAVACPGVNGSSPARLEDMMETYQQPRRKGFAVFEGSTQEESPEADPVNGVTGTVSLQWAFPLDGKAAPAPPR